jgi:hypothetical protein
MLAQGDRNAATCVPASASDLAIIRNLYTLKEQPQNSKLVDDIWAEYESKLAESIDKLINASISALEWARVLVPFVTCLLVRGPDFDERMLQRLQSLGFENDFLEGRLDNTNISRILEIQRLLAPIMVAEWKVIFFEEGEPLLTNDSGFMPAGPGIYVPLGMNHALHIIPKSSRLISAFRDSDWLPIISFGHVDRTQRETFNQAVCHNARRFVFGPNCDLVRKYLYPPHETALPPLEPVHLGFITGNHAIVHEFMWHRFVSALTKGIAEKMEPIDFDWHFEGLKEGWLPPIIFPDNLPEFPAGLRRQDDCIAAYLYDAQVSPISSEDTK